ncbi:Lebercilin-like protein [Platysternon megacephalum]|uniref:Lebercilin-like protein n=1 Tax=Platysternon megacephalum TaxID=55544 RepID=A0A4D9E1B3_9SAUR|nr:Lebercilin-like protein [Platysternon megacephalum]
MSSTSNTMMALDDCFLRIILPEDSKSESYTRSRGSNESPRTSKSTRSSSSSRINDYSRCSRECESESSHVNYSDDFLTDYSESAGNSNYLELSGTKEKKLQKKKNKKNGQPKGVSLSKSVQVNKQNFKSAQVSHHQKQGIVKSAALCLEEKKTEDRNRKVEPYEDTKHKIEIEPTTKPSKQETFNRTCREFLSDEIQLMEEKTHFQFMERKKKKREVQERKADLLKGELEKLMKAGQTRPTNDVPIRKNNQEKVVAEENKKEERKSKQLSDKGAADDKSATPTQNNRTPTRLKKQYTFTEATENLHQGLPASGPVSNTGSLHKNRQAGRHQSEIAELKARNSFGIYEPSFGKVTKTRQKDAEDGNYVCTTLIERKNSLMEELFGPSYVLNNHSTPNTKGLDKEQTIVDNERLHNYTSEISNTDTGLQCGDSKLTLGKSKLTTSSSDIK